jgi:hypothetical protein
MSPQLKDSDSVWQLKPWWCQPWSILLTGVVLIGGSWLLVRLAWLTILVAVPVGAWMGYFVLVYPKLVGQGGRVHLEVEEKESHL